MISGVALKVAVQNVLDKQRVLGEPRINNTQHSDSDFTGCITAQTLAIFNHIRRIRDSTHRLAQCLRSARPDAKEILTDLLAMLPNIKIDFKKRCLKRNVSMASTVAQRNVLKRHAHIVSVGSQGWSRMLAYGGDSGEV